MDGVHTHPHPHLHTAGGRMRGPAHALLSGRAWAGSSRCIWRGFLAGRTRSPGLWQTACPGWCQHWSSSTSGSAHTWRGSYKIRTRTQTYKKPGQIPGQFCYQPSDGLPLKLKGLIDGNDPKLSFGSVAGARFQRPLEGFLVFPVKEGQITNSKVISLVSAG